MLRLEARLLSFSCCWASGLALCLIPLGCASCPKTPEAVDIPDAARLVSAPASAPSVAPAQVTVRRFELEGTEVRALSSPQTGRDYSIVIRLPESFESEPQRRYPTLYLLDAQWNFELLHRIVSSLTYDQVIPEVLVVGITYAGSSPDYDGLRRQDFLPTQATAFDGKVSGGGAGDFLSFLEESVIPLAEKEYRAAPDSRILSGASYGGLFVLHALFEKPQLFNGYFAMSPSVNWDDRWIFQKEKAFRERATPLHADIWLSVGSAEWPEYVKVNQEFFQQMEKSAHPDGRLMTRVIEGEAHAGNLPEAHTRSLRFFFEEWLAQKRGATSRN